MTRLKTLLATAACAVTLAGGAALAHEGPMNHGWHHHGFAPFLQGVTLTPTQKEKVRAIRHSAWKEMRPQMHQLFALHREVTDQLASTADVTSASLAPLMKQEEQVAEQLHMERMDTMLKMRAVLTKDQLAQAASTHQKLEALHAQMRELLHPGHGDRHGPEAQ